MLVNFFLKMRHLELDNSIFPEWCCHKWICCCPDWFCFKFWILNWTSCYTATAVMCLFLYKALKSFAAQRYSWNSFEIIRIIVHYFVFYVHQQYYRWWDDLLFVTHLMEMNF